MNGNPVSKQELVQAISDYCGSNNVPPSELWKEVDNNIISDNSSSGAVLKSLADMSTNFSTLAKLVQGSQEAANFARMNITKEQF